MAATTPTPGPSLSDIFRKLATEYDKDLRGITSPFRREISPTEGVDDSSKDHKISKPENAFRINQYQWYPSDVKRRFVDDYFNNIDIAFAINEQATKKGFVASIKDAAMDKLNAVGNTLKDSVNQIQNSVSNIKDMLNGTTKGKPVPKLTQDFDEFIHTFPYAKIYEFKPQDSLGATVSALATAFKMIDNVVDGGGGFKPTLDAIIEGVQNFLKSTFKVDLSNPIILPIDPKQLNSTTKLIVEGFIMN